MYLKHWELNNYVILNLDLNIILSFNSPLVLFTDTKPSSYYSMHFKNMPHTIKHKTIENGSFNLLKALFTKASFENS
jgi:hypothetical protein